MDKLARILLVGMILFILLIFLAEQKKKSKRKQESFGFTWS